MGLTVAVSGRATVVNADVATHLAECVCSADYP